MAKKRRRPSNLGIALPAGADPSRLGAENPSSLLASVPSRGTLEERAAAYTRGGQTGRGAGVKTLEELLEELNVTLNRGKEPPAALVSQIEKAILESETDSPLRSGLKGIKKAEKRAIENERKVRDALFAEYKKRKGGLLTAYQEGRIGASKFKDLFLDELVAEGLSRKDALRIANEVAEEFMGTMGARKAADAYERGRTPLNLQRGNIVAGDLPKSVKPPKKKYTGTGPSLVPRQASRIVPSRQGTGMVFGAGTGQNLLDYGPANPADAVSRLGQRLGQQVSGLSFVMRLPNPQGIKTPSNPKGKTPIEVVVRPSQKFKDRFEIFPAYLGRENSRGFTQAQIRVIAKYFGVKPETLIRTKGSHSSTYHKKGYKPEPLYINQESLFRGKAGKKAFLQLFRAERASTLAGDPIDVDLLMSERGREGLLKRAEGLTRFKQMTPEERKALATKTFSPSTAGPLERPLDLPKGRPNFLQGQRVGKSARFPLAPGGLGRINAVLALAELVKRMAK